MNTLPSQGRLHIGTSIAVIDIGSNSVRLVVYEALTRAPTPLFNEKVLCGLGKNITTTKKLDKEAVKRALAALSRFVGLCQIMQVSQTFAIATAAARDAENGAKFIREAQEIIGTPIRLLTGEEEARYAALGIVSGIFQPQGLVGDMGGGSLELIHVQNTVLGAGITLPLGGLTLQDASEKSLDKAKIIIQKHLKKQKLLKAAEGEAFYAVGGTWRAIAKLHQQTTQYPLHVLQDYRLDAKEAINFCRKLTRASLEKIAGEADLSEARAPLLPFGALVLAEILSEMKAKTVVFSALGVREGLLYAALPPQEQQKDPLLAAASELSLLRSRAHQHGFELDEWSKHALITLNIPETVAEARLRQAACLLADIGWRAHPDYRGEQSLSIISNASFIGVTHAERAFLALSIYFRHEGLGETALSPRLIELATPHLLARAKVLGAIMRVAYLISAAQPQVLPLTPLTREGDKLLLTLPAALTMLKGEKLFTRLKNLGKLIGLEVELR
jgi:exopolyphosphatase / guanosine-5'-triphosphate,3'-diphosphate pyrophosphatase